MPGETADGVIRPLVLDAPSFEFADFEIPSRAELLSRHHAHRYPIERFTWVRGALPRHTVRSEAGPRRRVQFWLVDRRGEGNRLCCIFRYLCSKVRDIPQLVYSLSTNGRRVVYMQRT